MKNNIKSLIYKIRGVHVMLDSDLAKLFKCKYGTKEINQAVKRNIDRFPSTFCFQLTSEEYNDLKTKLGIPKKNKRGGIRYLPHVFTEEGVAMISVILKTKPTSIICVDILSEFSKLRL